MSAHRRDSDRWVTPRVVGWALFLAAVVVLAMVAAVTYLTARGLDPDPMIEVVAKVATAVGSLGTLALQLSGRATVAKVERNTGMLASKVDTATEAAMETASKVDAALWVDEHPAAETQLHHTGGLPPVPPLVRTTEQHPFGPRTWGGPGGGGEER